MITTSTLGRGEGGGGAEPLVSSLGILSPTATGEQGKGGGGGDGP